jgi:hypothetical protein
MNVKVKKLLEDTIEILENSKSSKVKTILKKLKKTKIRI